ncbi:transposase [Massilia consociata]|uniref:Transposase n=1 Tax=Massilia consociata TaxID=760117 RepID=A0ABV6FBK3_9BURK
MDGGKLARPGSVEPLAHRQRVNVLGALRHDGPLTWTTQQRPTTRDDVIAFFDQVAAQPHEVPRIVLIDNAGIYKGTPVDKKAKHGLYLYYLPPYSLSSIESRSCGSTPSNSGVASLQGTAPTCSMKFSL